jgi:hypothetical protein
MLNATDPLTADAGAAMASASAALLDSFFEVRWDGHQALTRGTPDCVVGQLPSQERGGGIYAGWRWDGARLVAFNDRYGFYPLFYAHEGDRIMVSPSLVRLLREGAGAELDEDALSVFLITGFYLGDDTPFRAIRTLPPKARFEWTEGRLSVSGEYTVPPPQELSFEQAVDGYITLFRQAIRRAVPHTPRIALPLSGGKDSRHILLELCEAGRPPEVCVTFHQLPWQEANLDVPIARELAHAVGVPHVVLDQPRAPLRTELRKNLATHLCSDEHAHSMVLADYLGGRRLAVYDGIAGDVLSESKVRGLKRTQLFQEGRTAELAQMELGPALHLPRFLRDSAHPLLNRERAFSRMEAQLARHVKAPNPFGSYRFWNRTRREIALSPFSILGGVDMVTPYLDHDLYDFLASLPARLLAENRLHTAAMHRAHPRYAHIPFDYERRTIAASRYPHPRLQATAERAWGRVRSMQWVASSAAYGITSRTDRVVDRRYALLRSVKSMLQSRDEMPKWMPRMLIYLVQLQQLAARPLGAHSHSR